MWSYSLQQSRAASPIGRCSAPQPISPLNESHLHWQAAIGSIRTCIIQHVWGMKKEENRSRITAVPCTQMQAGLLLLLQKKKRTALPSLPARMTKLHLHPQGRHRLVARVVLPAGSRSGFWLDLSSSKVWIDEESAHQWRTPALRSSSSSGVCPSVSPRYKRKRCFWVTTIEDWGCVRRWNAVSRRGSPQGGRCRDGAEVASRRRGMMRISIEVPVSTWHSLSFLLHHLLLSAGDAGEKYQHQCGEQRGRQAEGGRGCQRRFYGVNKSPPPGGALCT